MKWRASLIYLAAGASGFFVMGVELLGGRLLAPFFGTSIFVWGGIIAVFMTFLSVGYLLGGKFSMQAPSLQKLGIVMILQALSSLPVVVLGGSMLELLSYIVPDPRYGSLLGSVVLFGVPTLLSGMVTPYALRLLVEGVSTAGSAAGKIYCISTIGSALGTIITSFYLVLLFDIDTIIFGMIGGLFIIGMAVAGYGWLSDRRALQDAFA